MSYTYDNEYYSIVAAYSSNGGLWYYRLADIDNNKIIEAQYNTEQNEYMCEPVSFRSKYQIKNKYKTTVIKWKYDPYDDKRQYIEQVKIKGKVYEMAFLQDDIEDEEFNENFVREKLLTGFYVDASLNDEFLLVVGKKDDNLVCLLCNQKMFKQEKIQTNSNDEMMLKCLQLDKEITDLVNSVSMLPMYYISDDSIVTIDNLLDHKFCKNLDITARFFFENLQLPKKSDKFFVRKADDYTIAFFTKYLKEIKDTFELSSKDINKFVSIIQSIKKSESIVDDFKNTSGYGTDDLIKAFENDGLEILNVLRKDSEMNLILKDFLLKDDDFYEECLEQIKEEWEKSDDFQKLQKEREEKEISLLDEIDATKKELKKLNDTITELENRRTMLSDNLSELATKKDEINNSIDKSLREYKDDVVAVIRNVAPLELVNKTQINSSKTKGYIHKKNAALINLDDYECVEKGDYKELYEDLIDNISLYYSDDRSLDIAASVLSTFACLKAIIVDEAVGEVIANSISLLCDKKLCDTYVVQNADVDVNQLYDSISKNDNQIIYVNGTLNSYNEQLMKLLVSSFPNKSFIFDVDEENLVNLSKGIWKFATYIDLGNGFKGTNVDGKFIVSDYTIGKDKMIDVDIKNDVNLKKSHLVTDYQFSELSKLLSLYENFINVDKLPTFYINQVILNISITKDNIRDLIDNLYDAHEVNNCILPKQQDEKI